MKGEINMEDTKITLFEDSAVVKKTDVALSNLRLFKKILKKYGIIKNAQKLNEEQVNLLIEIKDEKETNNKNWVDTITDKIKEKYPDAKSNDSHNENEVILKEIQNITIEIQNKYKEIDKLKEKTILLIDKLK